MAGMTLRIASNKLSSYFPYGPCIPVMTFVYQQEEEVLSIVKNTYNILYNNLYKLIAVSGATMSLYSNGLVNAFIAYGFRNLSHILTRYSAIVCYACELYMSLVMRDFHHPILHRPVIVSGTYKVPDKTTLYALLTRLISG